MKPRLLANVTSRCRQPELMDQPELDVDEHVNALRGLETVNRISRTAAAFWPTLQRLAHEMPSPMRVLDVASGGGDVVRTLALSADDAGIEMQIDGCDISAVAVRHAQERARDWNLNSKFFEWDAIRSELPDGYDAIICSLFLHHLDEPDAVTLLRHMMNAARRVVLVDDLIRCRWGYLLAFLGTRLLSRSPIVHVDGPLSVAGAFTPGEALGLAERAGMQGAVLTRHWPQRFLLSWSNK